LEPEGAAFPGLTEFGEEPGAANVIKLVGNFLLGSAIEAMAEAFSAPNVRAAHNPAVRVSKRVCSP
jgi:3-hydroxyisobutyrate dehydrogenase-like beta-hydroxyacid dehydrogenase